jgi:hypothetical protein
MASFKGGENSTDPRRCTAHSSQTGKRCKNASTPGGRVCRYHGGGAPQVRKAAAERLRELEHPAIDMLATILGEKTTRQTNTAAQRLKDTMQAPTILGAIKIVFYRTQFLSGGRPPLESRGYTPRS